MKNKINSESKLFIQWSIGKLNEPAFYDYLASRLTEKLRVFLQKTDRQEILERLKQKLEAGGIEHGKPDYAFEKIERELELEMLDLIGWSMLHFWNFKKKPKV